MKTAEQFGKVFINYRTSRGMTQAQLGAFLSRPPEWIAALELGEPSVAVADAFEAMSSLGISIEAKVPPPVVKSAPSPQSMGPFIPTHQILAPDLYISNAPTAEQRHLLDEHQRGTEASRQSRSRDKKARYQEIIDDFMVSGVSKTVYANSRCDKADTRTRKRFSFGFASDRTIWRAFDCM